jgi:hypothetical protein
LANAIGLSLNLINFVNCDNDWYFSSTSMADRLNGLRLNTIIGCNN